MAKIIKLTQEHIEKCVLDFQKSLSCVKMSNGKVNYTKDIGTIDAKAVLYFEETAYLKMQMLIQKWDSEIAWHGVAKRYDDEENENAYIIEDILVYPQEVSGTTVNTDQESYQNWLYDFDDDVFDNIRMQGHSHVNMGVTPSTTDIAHQEKILDQLDDGMFYIFLIWNKKNDRTIKIYDMEKNILFETPDVDVMYISNGLGIIDFYEEATKVVTTKSWSTASKPTTTTASNASDSKKSSVNYISMDDDSDIDDDDYFSWEDYYGRNQKKKKSYWDFWNR